MRLFARLTLVAAVTAAGPLLSACNSLDSLQFWDTKKKLEGERKPVFPEGVPGITTGVPPDLYKGYREADGAPMDPAKAAAMAAAAEPEKPKVKIDSEHKPQHTAAKPAPKPASKPAATSDAKTSASAGAPAAAPPAQATALAPWPAAQPQAQAGWPGSPAR